LRNQSYILHTFCCFIGVFEWWVSNWFLIACLFIHSIPLLLLAFRSVKKERGGWRENDQMTDLYRCHSHQDMISYFPLRTLNHMIKAGFLQVRVSFHAALAALHFVTTDAKFRHFLIYFILVTFFSVGLFVLWMVSVVVKRLWCCYGRKWWWRNATDCHSIMMVVWQVLCWQVLCCGLWWSGSVDGVCNGYGGVPSENVRGKELGHVTWLEPSQKKGNTYKGQENVWVGWPNVKIGPKHFEIHEREKRLGHQPKPHSLHFNKENKVFDLWDSIWIDLHLLLQNAHVLHKHWYWFDLHYYQQQWVCDQTQHLSLTVPSNHHGYWSFCHYLKSSTWCSDIILLLFEI